DSVWRREAVGARAGVGSGGDSRVFEREDGVGRGGEVPVGSGSKRKPSTTEETGVHRGLGGSLESCCGGLSSGLFPRSATIASTSGISARLAAWRLAGARLAWLRPTSWRTAGRRRPGARPWPGLPP